MNQLGRLTAPSVVLMAKPKVLVSLVNGVSSRMSNERVVDHENAAFGITENMREDGSGNVIG